MKSKNLHVGYRWEKEGLRPEAGGCYHAAMIRDFESHAPKVADSCFVASSALVLGDVTLGAESSVWYGSVLRGDVNAISVGSRSNLQDGCVVHVTSERYATDVGDGVTVGHGAILHGCSIGSDVLVGISATVLDGAKIAAGSIIAAGSLVTPGKSFAERSLLRGSPAVRVREVSDEELAWIQRSAERYVELAKRHRCIDAT
jgi:carbonic anhydrase/acetyltransferase-like protein (isoleucine patch superfamily)